jgi:hypothetical protein
MGTAQSKTDNHAETLTKLYDKQVIMKTFKILKFNTFLDSTRIGTSRGVVYGKTGFRCNLQFVLHFEYLLYLESTLAWGNVLGDFGNRNSGADHTILFVENEESTCPSFCCSCSDGKLLFNPNMYSIYWHDF